MEIIEDAVAKEEEEESKSTKSSTPKSSHIPIGRVKKIMKFSHEGNIGKEASAIMAFGAEKFLEMLAEECFQATIIDKKKTLKWAEFVKTIRNEDRYDFLEAALLSDD